MKNKIYRLLKTNAWMSTKEVTYCVNQDGKAASWPIDYIRGYLFEMSGEELVTYKKCGNGFVWKKIKLKESR